MKTKALSRDLDALLREQSRSELRLRDFIAASGDRAFGFVFLLLSLPSALPLPAAGISTPLGLGILLIASQMVVGRTTLWLPKRILDIQISHSVAEKMVSGLNWLLRRFERFVKPRYEWISRSTGHVLVGVLIAMLAIVMQMPIPLTNTLPAAVIFFLAICLTEDDGLLGAVAGGVALIVVSGYIVMGVAILLFGIESVHRLLEFLHYRGGMAIAPGE